MSRLLTLSSLAALLLLGACSEQPGSPTAPDVSAIHERVLVLDAHADIEIPGKESRYVGDDGLSQVAPDKMRRGGTDAVVMSIAVGPGPRTAEGDAEARATADAELAAQLGIINDPANNLVLATTARELLNAHEQGKQAIILGLQNARILGKDIENINTFFAAGVRVFALTHMGHNDYADSSRPIFIAETGKHEVTEEHGGLSELGSKALTRINSLGAIFDISQLSRSAALQAMAQSSAPVIASHSNVQALSDVSRNLSDDELDALAQNGGVIHIAPFRGYLFDSNDKELDAAIRAARREAGVTEDYLYPFELYWEMDDPEVQQKFLNTVSELLGPGRIDDMLDHIDYVVNRIGVDHVGIGTDFNHGSGIVGYKDASEAQNITAALLERGYSEADISKIWGGNFVRVFAAAEAAATR